MDEGPSTAHQQQQDVCSLKKTKKIRKIVRAAFQHLVSKKAVPLVCKVCSSSFTEKAIAVSMNAWNCSGLDSWALRMMRVVENGQLIVNRIR